MRIAEPIIRLTVSSRPSYRLWYVGGCSANGQNHFVSLCRWAQFVHVVWHLREMSQPVMQKTGAKKVVAT